MRKTHKILVTGVGAIIGQGIIKSLKRLSYSCEIIGLDKNPKAFGFKNCDRFYVKPLPEEDPEYKDFLKTTIAREGIDLIIPGLDVDVFYFHAHRHEKWGTQIVLNSDLAIACGYDKLIAHEKLKKDIPFLIPTLYECSYEKCLAELGPLPFFLKPKVGSGSRGQALIYDEVDYNYWTRRSENNYIIQKLVGTKEEEYTVSVFGFGNGTSTNPIIFKRDLANTGMTMKVVTVPTDSVIEEAVDKLNKILTPIGPTNYQFRKEDNKMFFLEINPRISSSTSIRTCFGVNEAEMCIEYYLENRKPKDYIIKKGYAERFIEDYVEYL